MIYLDNAATTCPKPAQVTRAVLRACNDFCANPGRSGHDMSVKAGELVFSAREKAANFFGLSDSRGVIFTKNCTEALNIVIKGMLKRGDRVITSALEHNSVIRPLEQLRRGGYISYDLAPVYADPERTVEGFARLIRRDTRMIICTHASNVFGTVVPVEQIGSLAHAYGLLFVVDAAQSAGSVPIDVESMKIDALCLPGHKGLYGPTGTGMLILNRGINPNPLMCGGTGSYSQDRSQPGELPDALESGTLNVPGIAGLAAGMDFVKRTGIDKIRAHEQRLAAYAESELSKIRGVRTYAGDCGEKRLLSFNLEGMHSEQAAAMLNDRSVALRAGYHCAYCAHSFYGTEDTGTLRMSPGAFTKTSDIEILVKNVYKIAKGCK